MATREELLQRQLEKEREKKEQAEKRAKQIERQLAAVHRKTENRRKYVAGGYLLKALMEGETPCQSYAELLQILDKTLTRNIDRRAFDLTELPNKKDKKKKSSCVKKAQTSEESSRHSEQNGSVQHSKQTSLPPSLIAANIASDFAQGDTEQQEVIHAQNGNGTTHPVGKSEIVPTSQALTQKRRKLPETSNEKLLAEFNL